MDDLGPYRVAVPVNKTLDPVHHRHRSAGDPVLRPEGEDAPSTI